MVLVVEDLFWQVLVIFSDGSPANSCDFGMLMRGGEPRVFLLCHLGHTPSLLFFNSLILASAGSDLLFNTPKPYLI